MSVTRTILLFSVTLSCSIAMLGEAASGTLLGDGQMVNLDFTIGPASTVQGSRGKGKFRQGLDASKKQFGPAKVISHTATELRFKGKRDDCTLWADKTVTCKSGSKGTWR